ncbi:MAG: alpha/beta hydrolase-fold protein [Actinomycetota bacterium]
MVSLTLGGLGVIVAGGILGVELIERGVLHGKSTHDKLDGACSVDVPRLTFGPVGPMTSSSFQSTARNRVVGYTIAWPPGFGPGDELPLIVMLHGDGGSHTSAIKGMTAAQLVAITSPGKEGSPNTAVPTAIVTVDGGNGYWHPHPGDDPMGMVVNELIPLCQSKELGKPNRGIGLMGISMGGYGALAIAEHYPHLARAVAAISPAIWATYGQAQGVNARAYTDAQEFDTYNAITHAAALEEIPVRVVSGIDDPFHPGVQAFADVAPRGTKVIFSSGCHTEPFFTAQEPASVAFLSNYFSG